MYLHVFHPIWYQVPGGGGGPKGLVHNVLMQFFNPDSAKIELFETGFFDIVTTENDHPRYVKHISGCICVLFIAFRYRAPGGGGGAPKGLVHNRLMQLFHPDSSNIEVFETGFFDIVTPQNDHPRYVKHVLGRICMFFTLFGIRSGGGGGGAPMGLVHNLLMQVFTPGSSKIEVCETCFFDIVTTQNDHPRYVKHVSGSICVFLTLFGIRSGGGGGGSQAIGTIPAYAGFHPGQLKNRSF